MAELGETGQGGDVGRGGGAGHDITAGGSNIPPWRRPEVWQTSMPNPAPQQTGYAPPGYSGYGGAAAYGQWSGYGAAGGYGQPGQDYQASYAQYYQGQYGQPQATSQ